MLKVALKHNKPTLTLSDNIENVRCEVTSGKEIIFIYFHFELIVFISTRNYMYSIDIYIIIYIYIQSSRNVSFLSDMTSKIW